MKENRKKLAKEWFKRAEDDEIAIRNLLKEGGPFSTICFLSQQMAEKCLKGYLAFNGKGIKKIHDLGKILFLTRYYIATRYPGNLFEGISEKEAKEAFQRAKKIKEFIFKKLNFKGRKINFKKICH